jgi:hypothetical protein
MYARGYWGPQDFTVGAYYAGAIICFLFLVGIVFAEKKYVWWLVPLSVLSLMLSWGDSFSSFNYFMFDYFPGYNKFRSVNFRVGYYSFRHALVRDVRDWKVCWLKVGARKRRRNCSGLYPSRSALCLIFIAVGGFGSFLKPEEAQLPVWFRNASTERPDSFIAI